MSLKKKTVYTILSFNLDTKNTTSLYSANCIYSWASSSKFLSELKSTFCLFFLNLNPLDGGVSLTFTWICSFVGCWPLKSWFVLSSVSRLLCVKVLFYLTFLIIHRLVSFKNLIISKDSKIRDYNCYIIPRKDYKIHRNPKKYSNWNTS